MTDLSRLIADLCAGLNGPEAASLSGFPETLSGGENLQEIDSIESFRFFHSFQSKTEGSGILDGIRSDQDEFCCPESRASSSYDGSPERPETPEREAKTLAGSMPLLFPVGREEPERPEREGKPCRRPILNLNHAAPQRSDWWTGPAMAEVDALAPPAGEPLPISPADVRAGVAREMRLLAGLGVTGPEAQRRAVALTRAKVGNSPALAERQVNTGRCHACDEPLREADAAIAVLNPGAAPLHLHAACHDTYRARRRALVSRIMAAAGYGAEAEGEAA